MIDRQKGDDKWLARVKKRGTKDTKGTVKLINLKQTDNAMAKNKKDKQKNNSTHDKT